MPLRMPGVILGSVQEEGTVGGRQVERTKASVAILEDFWHQLPPPLALPVTKTSEYGYIRFRSRSKGESTAFVLEDSEEYVGTEACPREKTSMRDQQSFCGLGGGSRKAYVTRKAQQRTHTLPM